MGASRRPGSHYRDYRFRASPPSWFWTAKNDPCVAHDTVYRPAARLLRRPLPADPRLRWQPSPPVGSSPGPVSLPLCASPPISPGHARRSTRRRMFRKSTSLFVHRTRNQRVARHLRRGGWTEAAFAGGSASYYVLLKPATAGVPRPTARYLTQSPIRALTASPNGLFSVSRCHPSTLFEENAV